MKNVLGKVIIVLGVLLSFDVFAQLTDTMDQYAEQSQGNYQPMNMSYAGFNSNSMGMIQSAWQDPLQNLGEGQSKPAYSKYYWSPDLVLPIRLREGMITVLNFPEWEIIEKIYLGDNQSFTGDVATPSTVLLYPQQNIGVDTNMMLQGRSGNKYVFYLKSEGFNTERLTNSIVDIEVVGGGAGASGGYPSSGSGVLGGSGGMSAFRNSNQNLAYSSFTARFQKEDWLKSIPMDPTKFRFDIEIYVPNPDDVVIAPERVWRDDIFTYIDLGEKALNMTQRPIVTLIVERVETPIGFRTKGPNNRLIIVEGVGDMVMRSGKRMVCLKLRRSDEEGLQYVSYADDGNNWDVAPAIPSNQGQANNSNGIYNDGSSMNNQNSIYGNHNGGIGQEITNGMSVGGNSSGNSTSSNVSLDAIDVSKLTEVTNNGNSGLKNPYSQYKFGSAFSDSKGESLSIELGTDANVGNLEVLWKDLSRRYSSLLSGYEPFYSVDTPADGQGKELFHLRVGPVQSLDSGDSVCSQLGRNGVFCSVVRVQ